MRSQTTLPTAPPLSEGVQGEERWIDSSGLSGPELVSLAFDSDGSVSLDGDRWTVQTPRRTQTGPSRLVLTKRPWRTRSLTRYRPLIYLCVYGPDEIYDSCALTILSLRKFGLYRGLIVVVTDCEEKLRRACEMVGAEGVVVYHRPAADLLEYISGRFRIPDLPGIADYQPVLYVDDDVVCCRPIEPLLTSLLKAGAPSLMPEFPIDRPQDFYGRQFFDDEGIAIPSGLRGVSTAVIGFPHIDLVSELFDLVVTTISRGLGDPGSPDRVREIERIGGQRCWSQWYDQPVFNYLFFATGDGRYNSLAGQVLNSTGAFLRPREDRPRYLIHFGGGVGALGAKLPRMRRLFNELSATQGNRE